MVLRFYWRLVKRTPVLLWRSLTGLDTVTGVLALVFGAVGVSAWQQLLPWWSPFVAFGVILFYGFLRENYEEFQVVERERDDLRKGRTTSERRAALKDALAAADESGHRLYANEPSVGDAEQWVTRTHNLMEAAYGKGEARLFLSDAGYTFMASQHSTRQGLWVQGRLRRLAELMARVDSLDLRPDFDHQEWEGCFSSE
jgi:hypothetical protein